jgi:hypothetical protein
MAKVLAPEITPADLYLMVDQSTSLTKLLPSGQNLWQALAAGLDAFVNSPEAAGTGVGIQYFGIGTGTDACNIGSYSTPEVAIAPLPGNVTAIGAPLANHGPRAFTPTGPALTGALQYAQSWAAQHPTRRTGVVLMTDGYPTECQPQTMTDLGMLAATARASISPALTYVIGIGAVSNLTAIAESGGTRRAKLIDDTSGNAAQAITAALLDIVRDQMPGCAVTLPPPPVGTALDPGYVNVRFTPTNGAPQMLRHVSSSASCATVSNAWVFDNSAAPKRIIICPSTCNAFDTGRLDILYGCSTIVGP